MKNFVLRCTKMHEDELKDPQDYILNIYGIFLYVFILKNPEKNSLFCITAAEKYLSQSCPPPYMMAYHSQ